MSCRKLRSVGRYVLFVPLYSTVLFLSALQGCSSVLYRAVPLFFTGRGTPKPSVINLNEIQKEDEGYAQLKAKSPLLILTGAARQ
ncbi:hypothetical protein P4O66_002049 [Electrophorus voltai]|uniref:Uncharacterized protein n=1 Tax=Electrophorus voltai TaxID=2609070 RepID=A0AAD8Z1A0_9TELE|nr:hypothetical protein P4O66_002049 [Electrophorus voltai]